MPTAPSSDSQRHLDVRDVRVTIRRLLERRDRAIRHARAGVGEPECDAPRRSRIECCQGLELGQSLVHAAEAAVELCQLLARWKKRRRQVHRAGQGGQRLCILMKIAQAKPEDVMRFGKARVQAERSAQRWNAFCGLSGAVPHETQLVQNAM